MAARTPPQIVLDTNVLVAGLRSSRGASHRLLQMIGTGAFEINLSVGVVLEYEEVLKRESAIAGLTASDADDVIDYLCSVGHHRRIFFLWRPFLPDPDDDMLLELAVEAGCTFVVTHNVRDYSGIESFGVRALTPRDFLREIGASS